MTELFTRNTDADKNVAYFTVGTNDEISGDLLVLFSGRAPMTAVNFRQEVDYNVDKSLNGDFLVSAFGYKPVTFTISGFDLWGYQDCNNNKTEVSLQNVYSTYNVYANPTARLSVCISKAGNAYDVYTAILVSLENNIENKDGIKAGGYTLKFIGVAEESQ